MSLNDALVLLNVVLVLLNDVLVLLNDVFAVQKVLQCHSGQQGCVSSGDVVVSVMVTGISQFRRCFVSQ